MSARQVEEHASAGWTCLPCNSPLISHSVVLACDGGSVNVKLPCCPKCGKTFVPPNFAAAGIAEAEQGMFEAK